SGGDRGNRPAGFRRRPPARHPAHGLAASDRDRNALQGMVLPPVLQSQFFVPPQDHAAALNNAAKICTPEAAAAWRRTQGTVVFTNGVFDLLHTGHVALLEAARGEGDALIVGVKRDASARRLGIGPERPGVPEAERPRR